MEEQRRVWVHVTLRCYTKKLAEQQAGKIQTVHLDQKDLLTADLLHFTSLNKVACSCLPNMISSAEMSWNRQSISFKPPVVTTCNMFLAWWCCRHPPPPRFSPKHLSTVTSWFRFQDPHGLWHNPHVTLGKLLSFLNRNYGHFEDIPWYSH